MSSAFRFLLVDFSGSSGVVLPSMGEEEIISVDLDSVLVDVGGDENK